MFPKRIVMARLQVGHYAEWHCRQGTERNLRCKGQYRCVTTNLTQNFLLTCVDDNIISTGDDEE